MDIEILYKIGHLPTKYYNQLNGKTAAENALVYWQDKHKDFRISLAADHALEKSIEEALQDILKGLQISI